MELVFREVQQHLGRFRALSEQPTPDGPGHVLVQREMESRGFSIASIPPLRGGDFQGMGKSIEADAGGEDGG